MKRLRDWWADFRYYTLPWCPRCRQVGHAPVWHEEGDYEIFLRTLPR